MTVRRARRLGFLGAGNMAGALVKGVLESGLFRPQDLWATDADPEKRRTMRRRHGVISAASNPELVAGSDTVILAVKPQVLPEVLAEIRPAVTRRTLFVSIAAGITLARLESALGPQARVVRVMPNTPALLGRGMSVLVRGRRATAADERLAMRLFRAVGDALAVRDERLLDPVTGLSGSGPAYVYLFAEALVAGGVGQGLGGDVASRLVYQTLEGAVAMLRQTGLSPRQLRDMVTSPGGTTLAGLQALERAGFVRIVADTVAAATERSRELGRA